MAALAEHARADDRAVSALRGSGVFDALLPLVEWSPREPPLVDPELALAPVPAGATTRCAAAALLALSWYLQAQSPASELHSTGLASAPAAVTAAAQLLTDPAHRVKVMWVFVRACGAPRCGVVGMLLAWCPQGPSLRGSAHVAWSGRCR